jgi:hypothetical protein
VLRTAKLDDSLFVFGGSGSTLIAAQKTGRRGRIIEIDPIYVDRMIVRWQEFAKDDAVLAATGQTYAQVAQDRGHANKERRDGTEIKSAPTTRNG